MEFIVRLLRCSALDSVTRPSRCVDKGGNCDFAQTLTSKAQYVIDNERLCIGSVIVVADAQ